MKILGYLLFVLAIVVGILAVVGGFYVCVYQGWFLGILGVIESAKATPIESAKLAWSLIRVFLGTTAGGITCWLGWFVAAGIFGLASAAHSKASKATFFKDVASRDRRPLFDRF
ncbi:MAG: hypothetical protein EBU46_00320 [Nitrosomonadaceae bacterium]|nr:hypothetical protein [Nitrosomonadaceae bacterium]